MHRARGYDRDPITGARNAVPIEPFHQDWHDACSANDRLVLYRFDPEAALEKSGINYFLVTSRPPAHAARGAEFRYQVTVLSKKGGVKYKLESAPKGMTVSEGGLVRWAVPADADDADVILSATDDSGQEVFHTFKLQLGK